MADGCDVSKIVTTFLLNSCRLRSRLTKDDIQATICCVAQATQHRKDGEDVERIPLITGSAAEFYIEPMLPHFSDIDVMCHENTMLAIPRGHPPPTQLPAEFHNYVTVSEIIDSHLPGYVYLPARYLLTQSTDDGKYEYVMYNEEWHLSMVTDVRNMHGPALTSDYSHMWKLSVDNVPCVRCLVWPTQAADWPTRHRNYGWPDSATLDRVVSNGCDVVWHIDSADKMNGWACVSGDCHSHEQKLYC